MSDPKDKLVLFKEILSLMIVTIGFMTALMSSGVIRNLKVEPLTLIIIIAVILFFVQFLVRVVFGEEKYDEIKRKVLYTARDFSIILIVIIGFYFAGKYVANQSAPLSGPARQPAAGNIDDDKTLSTVPLKSLKKEKTVQPAKPKEKQTAKKSDVKPAKTELKAAPEEVKTAKQPAVDKKDGGPVENNLKTVSNEVKTVKQPATDENILTAGVKPEKTAEASPVTEVKSEQAAGAIIISEVKPEQAAGAIIISEAKPEKTTEIILITEAKPEKTAETALMPETAPAAAGHSAVEPVAATVENKVEKIKKVTETVVINVTGEDETDNELPLEKITKPVTEPVTEPVMKSPAMDKSAEKSSTAQSGEVLTYKMKKDADADAEDNYEDVSAPAGKSKTSVNFEQTPSDLRDKVNNDKVIIKKEYELNKTPGGIKNAGDKVLDGGRKLIDGGADLIEKAGQGIKKQFNKVIK